LARILYVWELGGGLGHLTTGLPLAQTYRKLGHEVGFVVKHIASADTVVNGQFNIYQAPRWTGPPAPEGFKPVSFAEILLQLGFADARALGSMVRAWLHLFDLVAPDLLMLDFSPTAMLAARIAGIRHCSIGHGFFSPPRLTPVPGFVASTDSHRLQHSEQAVLRSINQVRVQFGQSRLHCFADFLEVDLDLLTTWPEIEHYPQRTGTPYWGPILMRGQWKAPEWPQSEAPKVFAYLNGQYAALPAVLDQLAESQASVLVYAPGASAEEIERHRRPHMKFLSEPCAMSLAAQQASAVVCHANFGTVWESLLAGTPLLCLPMHREQTLVALRLASLGAAPKPLLSALPGTVGRDLTALIQQSSYRRAAQSVAVRYQDHEVDTHLQRIALASVTASAVAP